MKFRLVFAALPIAAGLAIAPADGVKALSSCTIVAGAQYTSTRCDSYSNPELFGTQQARHTCHTQFVTYVQYGYRVGIHQVSSAGPCGGTITNRLVQQW